MTVQCSTCGKRKPATAFYVRKRVPSGYSRQCKACLLERAHTRNNRDRDAYLVRRKERFERRTEAQKELARQQRNGYKARGRAFALNYLRSHPCVDCGNDDIRVLEFDHVRGKKNYNVGQLITRSGLKTLKVEMAKCEVRCANCHRIKSFERSGGCWRWEGAA